MITVPIDVLLATVSGEIPRPECAHAWASVPAARFAAQSDVRCREYPHGALTCMKCCTMRPALPGETARYPDFLDVEAREAGFADAATKQAETHQGVRIGKGSRAERYARMRAELEERYVGKRFGVNVVKGVESTKGGLRLRLECVLCHRVKRYSAAQLNMGRGLICMCTPRLSRRKGEVETCDVS